jgi:predicted metal-dependent hydrolase
MFGGGAPCAYRLAEPLRSSSRHAKAQSRSAGERQERRKANQTAEARRAQRRWPNRRSRHLSQCKSSESPILSKIISACFLYALRAAAVSLASRAGLRLRCSKSLRSDYPGAIALAAAFGLNTSVQLEWLFGPKQSALPEDHWLMVGTRSVRLHFVRNRRAGRYILRTRPDGTVRVTVPRGGALAEARRFAQRNVGWLEKELLRHAMRPSSPKTWPPGTEVFFRGERVRLEAGASGASSVVRFGSEVLPIAEAAGDLRPAVERHLRQLAARELPPRVVELAALHSLPARRVTVRNQRSRWGSCSRRGTISLNWRLVQAPAFVRDYLILHELAHLRQMNHSRRFWSEVALLCPDFAEAERWLKQHSRLLL